MMSAVRWSTVVGLSGESGASVSVTMATAPVSRDERGTVLPLNQHVTESNALRMRITKRGSVMRSVVPRSMEVGRSGASGCVFVIWPREVGIRSDIGRVPTPLLCVVEICVRDLPTIPSIPQRRRSECYLVTMVT